MNEFDYTKSDGATTESAEEAMARETPAIHARVGRLPSTGGGIFIDFGRTVQAVAMTNEQAIQLAEALIRETGGRLVSLALPPKPDVEGPVQ